MNTNDDDGSNRSLASIAKTALAVILLLNVMAVPVAAQDAGTMLCETDSSGDPTNNTNELGSLVNTWLQMMFSIGVVAAIGMYQYETLVGMVTFKQSQKRYMKEKKRDIVKAIVVLIAVGPLFTIFASSTIGSAGCVSFIPW